MLVEFQVRAHGDMSQRPLISDARKGFHAALLETILKRDKKGVVSNADKASVLSVEIAAGLLDRMGSHSQGARLAGQMSGNKFEEIVASFLEATYPKLQRLRPGDWVLTRTGGRNRREIAKYEQYAHLVALDRAAKTDPELAAALGSDYIITPDIIISRNPEPDKNINAPRPLVDTTVARYTGIRSANNSLPILHASVSCKWTIRSDRSQNARSEGLNLVRNRKGRLPHIAVVTGEPTPARIASIALGTGDIDCVYHFALHELEETVAALDKPDALEMLRIMIDGKRLRDISDLPLDLAT